ncbi:MAG: cob(I)yrinic acid a,c-diamide adenosyltransferase [Patescibacteria group bacterium]
MLQVYTGEGKGKTTAALGLVLRAVGAGKRVAIIQFDKGGERYSERKALERFPEVKVFVTGLDRREGKGFRMGITDEDKQEGERGLMILEDVLKQNFDLIVLDEINTSTSLGIVDEQRVLGILKNRPESVEIVLTGRNAPQSYVDLADLVSEVKMIKHYFYKGTLAREGLDY